MAEKEDIRKRAMKSCPEALRLSDEIDRMLIAMGGSGAIVTTTEDMTREEVEMALFAGFLKEGYSPEAAQQKAKEWAALAHDRRRKD